MRTEIKTITTVSQAKMYVSYDGIRFDTEKDCEEYEDIIVKTVRQIASVENCPIYDSDNYIWRWWYVKNQTDLDNILKFYNVKSTDTVECDLEIATPEWICFVERDDDQAYFDGTYADLMMNMTDLAIEFGGALC